MGNQRQVSWSKAALGWIALAEGTLDEAREYFHVSLALLRDLGANQLSVDVIYGLAGAAAAAGDVVRAARLEAVATHLEQDFGHQATAADSGIHRRFLDDLRSTTDPSVWQAAARDGTAMSIEQAFEYALSD